MCEICKKVRTIDDFTTPRVYLDCLKYIQSLVDSGYFQFESKDCNTDKVKDENGCSVNPTAAKIMAEETRKMILATKNLFYALQVHKKIHVKDIDMAATSFAMTVHAMMDYQLDCSCSGEPVGQDMIQNYIKWFCNQHGGMNDEKNID